MNILVTGSLGFIGSHVCYQLQGKHNVVGIDHPAYWNDKKLAEYRAKQLPKVKHKEIDVATMRSQVWHYAQKADVIIHLAAMAGVQGSMKEPVAYTEVNIEGLLNILECARHAHKPPRVIYASSSSVYGSEPPPHREDMPCNNQLSYYAATKRADEAMAAAYINQFALPITGLRFFTVYGPWGRKEMCIYKWALNIASGQEIVMFNNGNHARDFTYVDDVVEVIIRNIEQNHDVSILNAAAGNSIALTQVVEELENNLNKKAKIKYAPMQKGDVIATQADVSLLREKCLYVPSTTFKKGIERFIKWFKQYHNI